MVLRAAPAAVIAASVLATGSTAAPPGTRVAWPGASISYVDLTGPAGYHDAVRRAVGAWNAANVGVRFVAAPRQTAELKIVYREGRCLSSRAGSATSGFRASGGTIAVRSCPGLMRPLLVAHELGRVLGLPIDNSGCSLMNGSGTSDGATFALPSRCSRFFPPPWLDSLVDPRSVDIGRTIYASPAGPANVTVRPGVQPRIGWRQPADPRAASTLVLRGRGSCPTATDVARGTAPVIYEKPAFAGLHFADDTTIPRIRASYCYSIFTVNRYFRSTRYPGRIGYTFDRVPVAAIAVSTPPAVAGSPVAFVDQSTDTFGTIVHWHWTFGDPASGSSNTLDTSDPAIGRTPQHQYAQPGTYTVTLTAADDGGAADTATLSVVVQPVAQ